MSKAKPKVDPAEMDDMNNISTLDAEDECKCVREKSEEEIIAEIEAQMQEPVEIELFYDGDKYKDDVTVGVNGKTWLIKRGEKVTVPRFVAEVLKNSMEQDKASAIGRRMLESDFERNSKKYNASEE